MLGIQLKFQTCEKQKNRENKTRKEKQSHAQDSIYVVRQFAYVLGVARISLLSKKITMCGYSVFLSKKQQQDKTLITKKKKWLLYPAHRIHNGLQNGSGHQPDQIMPDDDFSWNKIHPLSSL